MAEGSIKKELAETFKYAARAVRKVETAWTQKRKLLMQTFWSSTLTHDLPLHTYQQRGAIQPGYSACADCNDHRLMSNEKYVNEDLNVLNFERVKWGGVRLNWLVYCLMDLELLSQDDFRKERGRGTDFRSVATWRGEDGYSRDKLEYYFGEYLS